MTRVNGSALQVTQAGRVLTITISNPPANFLTTDIMAELNLLLKKLKKRNDIGAVVFTSPIDGVFLTHFDVEDIEKAVDSIPFPISPAAMSVLMPVENMLKVIPGMRRLIRHTPMSGVADMNIFHEVTDRIRSLDKVFIAAINGRAMGAGCELALSCDFRIMTEGDPSAGIMIGQPEILLGLLPGGGGTQLLARSIGIFNALEHCLEGRPLGAAEALRLGIVHKVVPKEALMIEAIALAERMSRRSAFAVGAIKNAVHIGASLPERRGMRREKGFFLAAASRRNTRKAMKYYIPMVRNVLENNLPITIDNFTELIDGKVVDMSNGDKDIS